MTRKDYQLIADALALSTPLIDISEPVDARNTGRIAVWVGAVNDMAWSLENENSRFDRARFYKACTANSHLCNRFALSLSGGSGFERLDWLPAHDPVQA